MASKNVGDDEVLACPECDKTPVVTNSPGSRNGDKFTKYRCTTCNAHFDEPKVREDRGGPGIRNDCLAAKLEDAEPGDLVTDGGEFTDEGPQKPDVAYLCDECDTDLSDDDTIGVSQEVECWDLPNYFRDLCLEWATDEAMDEFGTDDREKARKAVLGAISA